MTAARVRMPTRMRACVADGGVAGATPVEGAMLVVATGAMPDVPRLPDGARDALEAGIGRLRADPRDTPHEILLDAAIALDRALVHAGPDREDHRATLVAAYVDTDTVWLARTAHGSVLLLRGGSLLVLEHTEADREAWSEWIGVGADGGGERLDCPPGGLALLAGDRLVLSTHPVQGMMATSRLRRLVAEGSPEAAAETLAGAIRAHRQTADVAVVVVAQGHDAVAEAEPDGSAEDLLAGLADLLGGLVDGPVEPEAFRPALGADERTFGVRLLGPRGPRSRLRGLPGPPT